MRFYWTYHPDYWEGLRRRGLLAGDVGVRFVHSVYAPEAEKANGALRPDRLLGRMILEQGLGLLIDRGCGGIKYAPYDFDGGLLETFAARLGERFLGIQMHEWYSNTLNDWTRIQKAGSVAAFAQSRAENPLMHGLEYGSVADYQGRTFPATQADFLAEADAHFQRKHADFGGHANLTDSSWDSYWRGYRQGVRHAMAEIGAQTALTRLQIASVRGAARAFGKPWGVYYEPWGGNPFSVAWHYRRHSFWQTPPEVTALPYFQFGGNGGGSRALQQRVLYHALLAGAGALAEEWGGENTFADWDTFPLTDYGQIMADVFSFAHTQDVGTPYTPIAIMFDADAPPLDHGFFSHSLARHGKPPRYMRFYEPTPTQEIIKTRLGELFCPDENDLHTVEACCLTTSAFPDACDLVASDIAPAALARYAVVVYLGDHCAAVQQQHSAFAGQWIDGAAPDATAQVQRWLTNDLPFWLTGPVTWTVNRTPRGWIVGLFNNHGVTRSGVRGDEYDLSRTCTATLTCKGPWREQRLLDAGRVDRRRSDVTAARDGKTLTIRVPAGDLRLLELAV